MVNSIPSLYPEIEERQTPPGKGQHGYFRRTRDKWIITHGAWPTAQSDMAFKGCIFLPQFGVFEMTGPGAGSHVRDLRGRPFNPAEEPWRLILQHPDGAAAFDPEQIIAYRWHRRPPYKEVVFPQLEGITIFDFECPECDKGIFSSRDERASADMLRQHLTSRFDAMHSYRPEDLLALGEEIGVDFFAARRKGSRKSVRGEDKTIEAPPEAPEMEPNSKLSCPECEAEFDSARQLHAHKLSHSRKPAEVGA